MAVVQDGWPEHCVNTAQKDTKRIYQYRQRHDDNKQKCVMNQTADQMKASCFNTIFINRHYFAWPTLQYEFDELSLA